MAGNQLAMYRLIAMEQQRVGDKQFSSFSKYNGINI